MKIIDRIPFLNRLFQRRLFKQEMASLNKRFKKQDDLYAAIDLEEESWIDVEFCPTFVDSSLIEGLIKSDGTLVGGFVYVIETQKLTTRELNENEKLDGRNHQTFSPLDFDYVTLDGWYEHSEGWNNEPGCSPGAAIGHIEDNGKPIAEFAFCFRCRKLEIKPVGHYLGNMLIKK
jgi:hypothetical protein